MRAQEKVSRKSPHISNAGGLSRRPPLRPLTENRLRLPQLGLAFLGVVGLVGALTGCGEGLSEGQVDVAPPSAEAKAASVVCREAVWDFGVVDQTKTRKLTHAFTLENVSDRPVPIAEIKPSCGCLVPGDHPTEIAAGSTADLTVTVNLARRPGLFSKSVGVSLGTSSPSQLTLTIRGQIEASPAFYLVPETVDFGTLRESETKTRIVKIARYDATPVRFVAADPQSKHLRVEEVQRGDEVGSVVQLTLSLDSSLLNAGEFRSSVIVLAENSAYKQVSVPIKAKIAGQPHGLITFLFVNRLRRGTFQDKLLSKESQPASLVEEVRYEGMGPIRVELLSAEDAGEGSSRPVVRISRTDEGGKPPNRQLVRGHLLVELRGRQKPARIPLTVYLAD